MNSPFFHVSRIEIVNRNEKRPSSLVHAKVASRRLYTPPKYEQILDSEVENVVANNNYCLKSKSTQRRQLRRLKRPVIFPTYYTNREVLKIPCFTFPRLNEQPVIKGRRTLCKLFDKGLVSDTVVNLLNIDDVSTLRNLVYQKERILQTHKFPHKSLLLKDSLEFKQFFNGLLSDPISSETTNEDTLRQYYLEHLQSSRAGQLGCRSTENNINNKFKSALESAARCYTEGILWHLTYLEVCSAKSACIRQQYVTKLQAQSSANNKIQRNLIKSDMDKSVECNKNNNKKNKVKSDVSFFDTTNSEENLLVDEVFLTQLNKLSLNNNNNSQTTTQTTTNDVLPTIILTDYSQSSNNSIKIASTSTDNKRNNSEHHNSCSSLEDQEQFLTIPSIRCRIESRPPLK